ncbi:MAG: glycosyltransferase family 4 protein [Planctomycetales bacterium]|nr:glycosyltransferase family 4 protein [Planctomycetales bacterium]
MSPNWDANSHATERRIFLDASYTVMSGKNSGIERVVRSIIREFNEMSREGWIGQPTIVFFLANKFYALNESLQQQLASTASMQAKVQNCLPKTYLSIATALAAAIKSRRLERYLLPQAGHLGIFKVPHLVRQARDQVAIKQQCQPVTFRNGDLLLLPDAYWINRLRSSIWNSVEECNAAGGSTATIVYDLIPLSHPEYVGEKRRRAFEQYMQLAANHSRRLLTISNSVRKDVTEYLASHKLDRCTVDSFELGAEINDQAGSVRKSLQSLFQGVNANAPYIMVSTLDPRKNHNYLLNTFDLLWNAFEQKTPLVLIGRSGAQCEELYQRIRNHPQFGQRLFHFQDLNDAELQFCYRKSRGVIFPSFVEGFGLPIAESLYFGKKTFVSDTPIHREVGREDCVYFNLHHPHALAHAILSWNQVKEFEQPLPRRQTRSWREAAQQILQKCDFPTRPSQPMQNNSRAA